MNLATLAEAGGLVLVLVGVVTLYVQLRDRVKNRIDSENDKRASQLRDAKLDGFHSRDDEVAQIKAIHASELSLLRASHEAQTALLRSQRDDARRDRDEAQRRADDYERRFNERRGSD